jgi:hypothetical protein
LLGWRYGPEQHGAYDYTYGPKGWRFSAHVCGKRKDEHFALPISTTSENTLFSIPALFVQPKPLFRICWR